MAAISRFSGSKRKQVSFPVMQLSKQACCPSDCLNRFSSVGELVSGSKAPPQRRRQRGPDVTPSVTIRRKTQKTILEAVEKSVPSGIGNTSKSCLRRLP